MTMLEPIGIRRLRKLQKMMSKIEDSAHFDMGSWICHNGEQDIREIHGKAVAELEIEDLHNCGTTACTLGYACAVPEFKKAGLRLDNALGGVPSYRGQYGFSAAQDFFGISTDDTTLLFAATRQERTPQQWAKHCQWYLDRKYPTIPLAQRILSALGL